MNRREFIGGFVATTALPVVADDPSVFSRRGRWERLALGYAHIEIGATKPFSVLHISDTHLTAAYPDEPEIKRRLRDDRTRCFGGRQEEALRDSLAWAKENVDYVIHTGDLIDWQSRANFDLVRKYFGAKMTGSMGNHEFCDSMGYSNPKETPTESHKDRSRKQLAEIYPFDLSLDSSVINGVNFVTLDDVFGPVTAEQVERFHAEVKKGLPIVLCAHVPFFTDRIWQATCKYWNGNGRRFESAAVPPAAGDLKRQREDPVTRDFIAYLKSERLLKAILTGHLHITMQDRFSPTAMEYVVGGNFMFHGEEVLFV